MTPLVYSSNPETWMIFIFQLRVSSFLSLLMLLSSFLTLDLLNFLLLQVFWSLLQVIRTNRNRDDNFFNICRPRIKEHKSHFPSQKAWSGVKRARFSPKSVIPAKNRSAPTILGFSSFYQIYFHLFWELSNRLFDLGLIPLTSWSTLIYLLKWNLAL